MRGLAGGFAIGVHIFNIGWITGAGFAAMWALGLSLDDVFSFGRKPRDAPVVPARSLEDPEAKPAAL